MATRSSSKRIILGSVSAVIIFLLGGMAGYFFHENVPTVSRSMQLRETDPTYPLISPLLLCSLTPSPSNEDMALKAKLASVVAKETKDGNADRISVFTVAFRSGEWAGVNENDTYDPASLLKVPIMIAYLQWAETNPSVLEQQFSYSGDDQNANEYFKSANDIRPGVAYTANDLLAHMIGNSDNNAALLLENSIPKDQLTKVYTDLKLSVPSGAAATPDYISAVQYAYFFRVLYNATYLDRFYSEKALDLLSLPDFTEGIVAGLPAKTVTAQKFGERSVVANNVLTNRELHDCGIVYKPNDPYLVCVMTQGTNFNALTGVIKDISALVYQNM